jgi:hypothetical protein
MTSVGTRVTSARRIVTLSTGYQAGGSAGARAIGLGLSHTLRRAAHGGGRRGRRAALGAARGAGAYDTRYSCYVVSALRTRGGGIRHFVYVFPDVL